MIVSFIVAFATGTILGLRFSAFVLVPAIFLVGIGTTLAGIGAHYDAHVILLSVAICLALLQIAYLAACLLRTIPAFHLTTPHRARLNPNQ